MLPDCVHCMSYTVTCDSPDGDTDKEEVICVVHRQRKEREVLMKWNFCCFPTDSATDLHISSFSSEQLPEVQHFDLKPENFDPEKGQTQGLIWDFSYLVRWLRGMLFLVFIFVYLAGLDLSCGTRHLCCGCRISSCGTWA